MLLEALNKLHQALEIIDQHDSHLSGIYVANAIEALSAHINQSDAEIETCRVTSGLSSH
jgi:hypothetical protein